MARPNPIAERVVNGLEDYFELDFELEGARKKFDGLCATCSTQENLLRKSKIIAQSNKYTRILLWLHKADEKKPEQDAKDHAKIDKELIKINDALQLQDLLTSENIKKARALHLQSQRARLLRRK